MDGVCYVACVDVAHVLCHFSKPPPTYEHVKWCSKPLWDCSGRELWITWSLVSFQQRAFHSLTVMHHLQGKHQLPRSRFMIPQITGLLMKLSLSLSHTLHRFSSKLSSVRYIQEQMKQHEWWFTPDTGKSLSNAALRKPGWVGEEKGRERIGGCWPEGWMLTVLDLLALEAL